MDDISEENEGKKSVNVKNGKIDGVGDKMVNGSVSGIKDEFIERVWGGDRRM